MTWLGVDVGGPRKGFDVALVDSVRVISLAGGLDAAAVCSLVDASRPALVGIDSPCRCAPDGETSRKDERLLARAVCGIRWTPDAARVHGGGSYYSWIVEGLRLYALLAERGVHAVEVFPTASWTRWHGARDGRPRSDWTREALSALGLDGVPGRTNQDQRDAIAAAVTARQHTAGATERFGDIVVPVS
jgi:predicted nuclease with RNAse H fold